MTVRVCHPVPSLFSVWRNLVACLVWDQVVEVRARHDPPSFIDRNAHRCAAGLLIRVRLVRSQLGQPFLVVSCGIVKWYHTGF